jgi:predicted component of type VI protein secretion system
MEPGARVAWVVETAKAVLEGRLSAAEGAAAVQAQQSQLSRLLRQDRDSVTRRESEDVADRLRMLAEQVSDTAAADPENEDHLRIAQVLAELSRSLR